MMKIICNNSPTDDLQRDTSPDTTAEDFGLIICSMLLDIV